jgi:uncharacterized alkaline shock family protein YloU
MYNQFAFSCGSAAGIQRRRKRLCSLYVVIPRVRYSPQGGMWNMECKIKNDIGTVFISEDVMLKVAGYAALECYGIVAMSSQRAKDGFIQWLGRENLSKGVQLKMVDDMLDVDLFIIVEYGISIGEVCKTIVETVRYKLESMTGIKIRRVNISVEGVRV